MKTLDRFIAFALVSLSTGWLLAQSESPHASPHGESEHAQHQHGSADSKADDSHSGGSMMEQMHKMMQAHMQAADDGQIDALLAEMNGATGEKKIEAMAALLNRLVQERKSMQQHMAAMHMQMMGEMGGRAVQEHAESDGDDAAHGAAQNRAAERAADGAKPEVERAVAQIRRDAERAVAEARQQAERATAEAREIAAKAAAERDEARRQVEQAIAEARANADKADAVEQEAQRAILAAREQAKEAAVSRERAIREADRARVAEREAAEQAKQAAAAERAARDSQKKSDDAGEKRP